MKSGEYIYARTHAEFLNELLRTHYRAWMKSSICLPDGKRIWMIELGHFVTHAGWINQLQGTDKISERVVTLAYETHNTYKRALIKGAPFDDSDRIVFDIKKSGSYRKYVFCGVFRLNKEQSTVDENVWDLITDEYEFRYLS